MKTWFQDNDREMCLAHIKGKSAVAERLMP